MQVFPRKRYRFFYPAGLISLVLLPLLGILYINAKPTKDQEYAIELNIYSPEQTQDHPEIFPDPITMRKYSKIYLTGENHDDSLKLINAQVAVRQILSKKDTVNGIQVVYGPKAKYKSFIQTINLCLEENARAYTPYKNSFLILYHIQNPKSQKALISPICGTPEAQAYKDQLYREANEAEFMRNRSNLEFSFLNIYKHFWPTAILYIILVGLTAKKVKRQLQKAE